MSLALALDCVERNRNLTVNRKGRTLPLAPRLNHFVDEQNVRFQLIHHAQYSDHRLALEESGLKPECAVKVVALIDARGPAAAVIPYYSQLNIGLLNESLGRTFQILSDANACRLFSDCESGHYPAFPMAYGLPVVLDESVLSQEYIVSHSGCQRALLKLSTSSFSIVMKGAIKGNIALSSNHQDGVAPISINANKARPDVAPKVGLSQAAAKLEKLYRLPPMPETAVKILHMTADEEASVGELAALIERDPSLSAQVMRYARSALFAYRGEITCIREAVNIVLGFDRVAQLAMGLAASKAFNIPNDGPFGLTEFWKHALYSAVLCQALALMASPDLEFDEREAYLSGMLHNFGILLIGHLFPPEFRMLNKLRQAEPEAPMRKIEEQVFGMGGAQEFITMGHGTIGAILLKLWGLPESSIKAAGMHQNYGYSGEHEKYVRLVQLSNALLADYGVGDELIDIDKAPLMDALGLSEDSVQALMETLLEQCNSLDGMIRSMAA